MLHGTYPRAGFSGAGCSTRNLSVYYTYDNSSNPSNWYNGTVYSELGWTQGRRLAGMNAGGTAVTYTYDMSGLRATKTVGGVVHEYEYLSGRLMRETYGTVVLDFIYNTDGSPLAMRYSSNGGTSYSTYYYVRNLQGDVEAMYIVGTSTPSAVYEYDPWGKLLSVKNSSGTVITDTTHIAHRNPIRYRGYYYDSGSGYYYLQSRYYDPAVGRFLNADDYASTGQGFLGHNMYAYCNNNPIIAADHNGKWLNVVIGAVIGGVISFVSSVVSDVISNKEIDWGTAKISAAVGAATGAVIALCPAAAPAANALGGAIESFVDDYRHNDTSMRTMGTNALVSAGISAITGSWGRGIDTKLMDSALEAATTIFKGCRPLIKKGAFKIIKSAFKSMAVTYADNQSVDFVSMLLEKGTQAITEKWLDGVAKTFSAS